MSDDPLGAFPDPETVAEQLGCARRVCVDAAGCWTRGGCQRRYRPDPKGSDRVRDSAATRRKVQRERECRIDDCGDRASDPHHLVFRSQGGDDVEDNIIPLCHADHMSLHFAAGPEYERVRRGIGETLTDREVAYVMRKLGPIEGRSYLQRNYYWKES